MCFAAKRLVLIPIMTIVMAWCNGWASLQIIDKIQITTHQGSDIFPAWSPDGSKIVFASDRYGNYDLFIIEKDGSNLRRLTNDPIDEWAPSWSPDGTKIAFSTGPPHNIWVIDTGGQNLTQLTDGGENSYPAWNPDGSLIVFHSYRDMSEGGDADIYVMNQDGSAVERLTIASSPDGCPQWSPDGTRIVWQREIVPFTNNADIWIMNSDGSDQIALTSPTWRCEPDFNSHDLVPSFSPDGYWITFSSCCADPCQGCPGTEPCYRDIWLMCNDGTRKYPLTFSSEVSESWPRWSPDGMAIAIESDEAGNEDIWLLQFGFWVAFDIKPGSCPNPLNVKLPGPDFVNWGEDTDNNPEEVILGAAKTRPEDYTTRKSVIPAAILGTADLDVMQIDATTVCLNGIPVLRWNYEDVAAPVGPDAGECECNTAGPDGFVDMTLKFDKEAIIAALGEVYDGEVVSLTVSGQLVDGTPFEGADCVLMLDDGPEPVAAGLVTEIDNYPNPFNPSTTLSFALEFGSDVKLDVYNITGQLVTTIIDRYLETGRHSVVWDGKDHSGKPVSSGIYFYRVQADDVTQTRKMILLK